jgi:uncharacterized protein YndB with AHSA1/START domain
MKTETLSRKTVLTDYSTLTITRVFNAPRKRLWQAWTDAEQVKHWWGPKVFTTPHCTIDLRLGGHLLMCMRSDSGPDIWKKGLWSTGVYEEIKPPEKIVYSDSFSDEYGNVVPGAYYGMEGFPDQMEVTVTFEEVISGRTKMTLQHAGLPSGMINNCRRGWSESFDKLEVVLRGKAPR